MPLSPTDQAILVTVSDCKDESCGWPLDALLQDHSAQWLMHCAAEGRTPPSPVERAAQIEQLADAEFLTVTQSAELYWLGSAEPSRAVRLTEQGRKAVDAYELRFSNEEQEQRAIEFVRGYVSELAKDLPFHIVLPAFLPPRFSLLPKVEIDRTGDKACVTYYGGEDHFILTQGSEEPRSEGTTRSRSVEGVVLTNCEQQETSLWASMTFRWNVSYVHYRLSFNWLHQLSTANPERAPIVLDDSMRREAWMVVESTIAEAMEL